MSGAPADAESGTSMAEELLRAIMEHPDTTPDKVRAQSASVNRTFGPNRCGL